jgi:hypothetical protein
MACHRIPVVLKDIDTCVDVNFLNLVWSSSYSNVSYCKTTGSDQMCIYQDQDQDQDQGPLNG